jgi:glucarate dehydratase
MQPYDVVVEDVRSPRNNVVRVPEGPGLGVTLDQEALQRQHDLDLNDGPSVAISRGQHGLYNRLPRY